MSWDKNTINISKISSICETLDILGIPYGLTILGIVDGKGHNDNFSDEVGGKAYSIRMLTFYASSSGIFKKYFVEQMQRAIDCDMDDYLVSFEVDCEIFDALSWPLEITDAPEWNENSEWQN
jgi:hypothetical protein